VIRLFLAASEFKVRGKESCVKSEKKEAIFTGERRYESLENVEIS